LRCLGQRWIKVLWKMRQTKTLYDEARHLQNQRKHGSPFALVRTLNTSIPCLQPLR
jgi:hypothetical protein